MSSSAAAAAAAKEADYTGPATMKVMTSDGKEIELDMKVFSSCLTLRAQAESLLSPFIIISEYDFVFLFQSFSFVFSLFLFLYVNVLLRAL